MMQRSIAAVLLTDLRAKNPATGRALNAYKRYVMRPRVRS
jgi:hypothetical protein